MGAGLLQATVLSGRLNYYQRRSHGLRHPSTPSSLAEAEQLARQDQSGIWAASPEPVPMRSGPLIRSDAWGVRFAGVNNLSYTEYVEIENTGDASEDLSRWLVSGTRGDDRYYCPEGYTLQPGATVRLHRGGKSVDAPPGEMYWTTDNPGATRAGPSACGIAKAAT